LIDCVVSFETSFYVFGLVAGSVCVNVRLLEDGAQFLCGKVRRTSRCKRFKTREGGGWRI